MFCVLSFPPAATGGPILITRGEKLQLAMRMLAEGKMSDEAIAKRLHIKGKCWRLFATYRFFERRADQIREELNRNPNVKKRVASGEGY